MKLKKYDGNPILRPQGDGWESLCVLNPAVIYDEEEKLFKMLYRAAGNDKEHKIYIGYAESRDGFHFDRRENPVLSPDEDGADGGCVEDPRLVKMGGYYYLTYASRTFPPGQYWREDKEVFGFRPLCGPAFVQNNNSVTHLAVSRDLLHWKKLGRIGDSRLDDRDVILFPEKINGRFVRLSRPMEWCGGGRYPKAPSMWISFSDDLAEWRETPELLLTGSEWWEDKKIGGSTPPVRCPQGWLLLYHGVSSRDGAYRVGAVICDGNDPRKILAKTKDFLLEPEFDFETQGYYNGCVFPTGICLKEGVMYVYYGAADKFVGVATADFGEFCESGYEMGKL